MKMSSRFLILSGIFFGLLFISMCYFGIDNHNKVAIFCKSIGLEDGPPTSYYCINKSSFIRTEGNYELYYLSEDDKKDIGMWFY